MLDPERPPLADPPTDADHAHGPAGAAVTLVEFVDYECPACLNATDVVARLREHFGEKLRVVYRHFPRHTVHPHAGVAAQAAEAAAAQDKFFQMHDELFAHQQELAGLDLNKLAVRAGLDLYKFEQDLRTQAHAAKVAADAAGGERSGVTGSPAFFLNNTRYRGSVAFDTLREDIDQLLKETP